MKNNDSSSSSLYSRRDFLKTSATVAGAYVAATSIPTLSAATAVDYGAKRIPFAVQTYALGGVASSDTPGTLAQLRSWGITGIEFTANYLNKDAPTLKKMLDDAGIKAVGVHTGAGTVQGDALKQTIEFNQAIGNSRLILPSGATGMAAGGGGGRGRGGAAAASPIQGMTTEQVAATGMTDTLTKLNTDLAAARTALNEATFSGGNTAIAARAEALAKVELDLAKARSETLAKVQASTNKLSPEQLQTLVMGGRGGRGGGGRGGAAVSSTTRDQMLAAAAGFNAVADILKPLNMYIGYHCHPGDFALIDGTPEWDVLFSNTKPEVIMQIDLGHMGTAGGDQAACMARYPGRAKTVHVKPANGGGGKLVGDPNDANNWPAIFKACESVGGTEWYVVEYDGGNIGMIERTMARMKEWGKV